ncbi:MAG: hydantoinase/oxoprolinase family protein [Anaerolineae bacterium]|nr:hydantoinase/oxoprolinase family protein [Gemmatimonadaceae bacterium]
MTGSSVGVDVGGTFTDVVSIDDDGDVVARKVLSTPTDQSDGVIAGLRALGIPPAQCARMVHGTTVATNTLLERNGARVVLCATEGATSLLELRRQERASLYDLTRHHPPALVPPDRCIAVPERLDARGVVRALTRGGAEYVASRVGELHPECVAVALLHSYRDPSHEHELAQALHSSLGGVDVILSSDVLPEIREYERTATTVAEAYLRPRVARYLSQLADRLKADGFPAPAVMTSAGGMRSAGEAARSAASLALSGPAGGVVGAAAVLRLAGFADALTIDIGGTSADAGLITGGKPLVESGGDVAGVPIALPRVLIDTVSAGGGSIGWTDAGGALRVGPRSAGVRPGPAAFGLGGVNATITDAHIVLGRIQARRMSGGITLDIAAARRAIEALAGKLGATVERTATAMIAAADAAMARALRRVSVERGVDPRRCVLVAFGGGGGLHACGLADQLAIRTILVPPFSGVLSALGLAMAPERREGMVSVMLSTEALGASDVAALARQLSQRAGAADDPEVTREWWARTRYVGQGHELDVPFTAGDDGASIARRFTEDHHKRLGFSLDRPVEIVSSRHAVTGQAREPRLRRAGGSEWSANSMLDTNAPLDVRISGLAVVTLADSSMLVAQDWTARALPIGGWLLEKNAG